MRILAVSGSLREGSFNTSLLRAAVEAAPDGVELSKRLKKAGFRFVGPTTVYAAMQATGIVNDHVPDCWVRAAVEAERA